MGEALSAGRSLSPPAHCRGVASARQSLAQSSPVSWSCEPPGQAEARGADECPAPQSPALGLGSSSGGSTGLLPWGMGPPVAVPLECGSEVGEEGFWPLFRSDGLSYTAVSWSSLWIIW